MIRRMKNKAVMIVRDRNDCLHVFSQKGRRRNREAILLLKKRKMKKDEEDEEDRSNGEKDMNAVYMFTIRGEEEE